MKNEFYLVHNSILPDDIDKVIECRNLVESQNNTVSEACKIVNIPRSKYYKYKDLVFAPSDNLTNIIKINFKLKDEKGLLSNVLNVVSSANGNVITINQDSPNQGNAYITLTLDIKDLNVTKEELIKRIENIEGANSVKLVTIG